MAPPFTGSGGASAITPSWTIASVAFTTTVTWSRPRMCQSTLAHAAGPTGTTATGQNPNRLTGGTPAGPTPRHPAAWAHPDEDENEA